MKTTSKLQRFSAAGKQVVCPHCGGADFASQEILLNTRAATFLNLDWLNRAAVVLVCSHCSRLEWFNEAPVASN
jgi:predicted nucleic-acid-binding Zn-ribbon protein